MNVSTISALFNLMAIIWLADLVRRVIKQSERRIVSVFVKVDLDIGWQCSNCEKQINIQIIDRVKYCPYCGAQIHDFIIPKEQSNEKND